MPTGEGSLLRLGIRASSSTRTTPRSPSVRFRSCGANYAVDFSEEEAKKVLSEKEIVITVSLHQGNASATFWTCDLSKAYVDINANYRT